MIFRRTPVCCAASVGRVLERLRAGICLGRRRSITLSSLRLIAAGVLLAIAVSTADAQSAPDPVLYLNPSLPLSQRVQDVVSRMTLEEEVSQMQNGAPAIPRLNIPEYDWWNEGLHGVARSGHATVFPQAIGLAATWDRDLIRGAGDTISTEARARYNEAQRAGNRSIFYGLTFWSPNINIDRDPRWGRGQETYGEDPFLTGELGSAFVKGMQGSDPHYLKVVATPKHFAVHSGPESERHTFDAVISAHDLADTYLPAFRELVVDAKAASVMCAYNSVDGAPACASKMLLKDTLRGSWHFEGFTVSDCAAISDISAGHKFATDLPHAAAAALEAGTDLSCGREFEHLAEAVRGGLVPKSLVDAAVTRLFTARFQLGMFDPPENVPWSQISATEIDSTAHQKQSLEAARESMVLLRNQHATLPLKSHLRSIAVIGPNAADLASLEGNYNGAASHPVTPLAALESRFPGRVHYAQGSPFTEGFSIPVPQTQLAPDRSFREHGLHVEFFNGGSFEGTPVAARLDRNIDFDWNGAAPVPGLSSEHFSVRWTGFVAMPEPGKFKFSFSMAHCSTCDDTENVRVWLDDTPAYDFHHKATHGRRAPTTPFEMAFADTQPHRLRIEYTHESPHFGAGLTFNWTPTAEALRRQAVDAATRSDVVVAFLGLSPELEGEEMPIHVDGFQGGDRTSIELPQAQQQLVTAVAATGKPLILVLMNGGAIALGEAVEKAGAILEAWYPGENGGTAIAETLFGENNPAGCLPITFYAATDQLPAFTDYSMKDRTYRYFKGRPLYPFGFGLSYTRFELSDVRLSQTSLKAGEALNLNVAVRNAGSYDGDDVIQAYLVPKNIPGAPIRTLVGFQRVHLAKGSSREIQIAIEPRQLSLVSAAGDRNITSGEYALEVVASGELNASPASLPFRIVDSLTLAP
jgi:beta-glucosidase